MKSTIAIIFATIVVLNYIWCLFSMSFHLNPKTLLAIYVFLGLGWCIWCFLDVPVCWTCARILTTFSTEASDNRWTVLESFYCLACTQLTSHSFWPGTFLSHMYAWWNILHPAIEVRGGLKIYEKYISMQLPLAVIVASKDFVFWSWFLYVFLWKLTCT